MYLSFYSTKKNVSVIIKKNKKMHVSSPLAKLAKRRIGTIDETKTYNLKTEVKIKLKTKMKIIF